MQAGAFGTLVQLLGAALSWILLQNSPYSFDLFSGMAEAQKSPLENDKVNDKLELNAVLLDAVAKRVLTKNELAQLRSQIKVSTLTTGNDSDTDEHPTARRSKNDTTLNFDE